MASAIDASKPADGVPAVKADLRANLLAAKNEIEALDGRVTILESIPPGGGGPSAFVSVKDFGAVGNGTTDDLTAIQNAINSVSGDGGFVFFPRSTAPYLIDGTIQMKANVVLIGEYAGSIIKLANGANVDMVLASGALPHIGLRDLIFYGNRQNQNGDATKNGINWALSNTTSGYTGNSTVNGLGPAVLVDPFYKVQNVVVMMVDGTGIRAVGAHGLWHGVDVLNVNSVGIRAQANDTQWVSCNVGATAHEGWLCAGGSARYTDIKAFFCGTGYNQQNDTYGNYVNGYGIRVTSRGQHFVNVKCQDCDAPGMSIQANDIIVEGLYCDNTSQLVAWSTHLGQTPIRGGGYTGQKVGLNIQGASNLKVGAMVTARGVVQGNIAPQLQGIVRLNGASSNIRLDFGFTQGILAAGGVEVLQSSFTGTRVCIDSPGGRMQL
jgi:Pectate lyase superfamily protein